MSENMMVGKKKKSRGKCITASSGAAFGGVRRCDGRVRLRPLVQDSF